MSRRQVNDDQVVAEGLEALRALGQQFTYDLALLIAGHEVDFGGYVDARVAERLRAAVEPLLDAGDAMRPNFGESGRLVIRGNLRDEAAPVTAVVLFDHLSARELSNAAVVVPPVRRMRLELKIARGPWRITDYRLLSEEAAGPPRPV